MVSKCANPACSAQLHYLHDGRIFRFDIECNGDGRVRREYFWLCQRCAGDMTLTTQGGRVVAAKSSGEPPSRL